METEELFVDLEAVDEAEAVDELDEEQLRQLRRRERIEEMKRQKERALRIHRCILGMAAVVLLFVGYGIGGWLYSAVSGSSENTEKDHIETASDEQGKSAGEVENTGQDEDEGRTEDVGQENLSDGRIVSVLKDQKIFLINMISAKAEQTADEAEDTGDGVEEAADETGDTGDDADQTGDDAQESTLPEEQNYYAFTAHSTDATAGFSDEIVSEFGILVDVEEGSIIAEKRPFDRMNPASMTKVLTVLTAAEILGIEDENNPVLEDSFTITYEITNYSFVNDCSIVGFDVEETVSVRDLFYGTILPSGADAALGLAIYASGSHEEFVERMNEELRKLGLSDTAHFTNCVGLYDENHYCTVYDMAVILKEAADNPFCRQVLSAHTYATSLTEQHPEGLVISNWFLRRIEDRDTHGEVLCGKTGFTDEAGNCAASLAVDINGREYLCVTGHSTSSWQCIDDQTALFQEFLPAVE